MKTIKIMGYGIFALWFFGAAIMMCVYEIERKHECIDTEGWVKGLIWCESDVISNSDTANRQLTFFIKGLNWPIKLFSNSENEEAEHDSPSKNLFSSLEEFNNSGVAVAYRCYTVAMRASLHEDASIIAIAINRIRELYPNINSNHEIILMYTSETIINRIKNELDDDYVTYYNRICKEPVKNIKQMLNDGML